MENSPKRRRRAQTNPRAPPTINRTRLGFSTRQTRFHG
jgi:hypothetical protein